MTVTTGDSWTQPTELGALRLWSRGAPIAVEVGTWTGRSAEAILQGMDGGGGGVLFCVDHFQGAPNLENVYVEAATPEGRQAVKAEWYGRLRPWVDSGRCFLLEAESATAAKMLAVVLQPSQRPQFVFIDGDHHHEAVSRDIDVWLPMIRPGGFLCGHDYQEVKGVVDERFRDRLHVGPMSLWRVNV